ncbi:MAG: hypothetical protein SGI84_11085, partial [Gemmatimonadota bacterium]|nr:hypothetical protein [Gemmatimonadota bacterium]
MSAAIPVRVTVLESWDEVSFAPSPETAIHELKRLALRATRTKGAPEDFLVKYLGAELSDESASLVASGVVPHGALIVLRRRRAPTR